VAEHALRNLRAAYGETLVRLMERDERIVVLDADLCRSTMTVLVEQRFPARFIEMGIAEQNMMATAAGLALEGKVPFVNSFAVFTCGRAYDQIRLGIALGNLGVTIVGSSAGLSDFGDGATHQSIEDVSLMASLPNMTIISPSDALDVEQVLPLIVACRRPVYLRLTRTDLPVIHEGLPPLDLTGVRRMHDGRDVVIFATGAMVIKALEAAEGLLARGVSARVVDISTLKPLAIQAVLAETRGVGGVVTAEEHSIIGGLGSAIGAALRRSSLLIEVVGIEDRFGTSGESHVELMEHFGLTVQAIVRAATSVLLPRSGGQPDPPLCSTNS
jgi:transketolase